MNWLCRSRKCRDIIPTLSLFHFHPYIPQISFLLLYSSIFYYLPSKWIWFCDAREDVLSNELISLNLQHSHLRHICRISDSPIPWTKNSIGLWKKSMTPATNSMGSPTVGWIRRRKPTTTMTHDSPSKTDSVNKIVAFFFNSFGLFDAGYRMVTAL